MGKTIRSRFVVFLAVLLTCGLALAQQPEVSYSDEFQSYGSPKNPPGWVDTAIGASTPVAGGLFKTWPDPTQGNKASNIVFGSKSSSGKPEGDHPRMGHFSTLTTKTFSASGRFEYRGRFIRTSADSRIGFTFLSSYPEQDKYYLIGLWSVPNSSNLTMQLFGFGAGSVAGTTNSNFTPAINTWYRFLINVDDLDGATKIRARFWADGTTEPAEFSIDATDAAATRLTSGRIGIWAAVKGANYVDDLFAKSPVDYAAPVITFTEDDVVLAHDATTPLGHDARVDVRADDDLSGVASLIVTRNGEPYVPLTPIATEGTHEIEAVAVDHVGNSSTAKTTVLVDKTPPVITLATGGSPLEAVSYFNIATAIDISAVDVWTGATVTATLDGQPYASGTPITVAGPHYLTVQAVDGVGNLSLPVQAKIVIDYVPPVITFVEKGTTLTSPATFKTAPAIEIKVDDDFSPIAFDATLDGAPWKSFDPVPPFGWHTIRVVAKDAAGNEAPAATLRVLFDDNNPVVELRAAGVLLDPLQTAKFKERVVIDVAVTDPTIVTGKTTVALNGQVQPYTPGMQITIDTEGNPHTVKVHAEDEAGNETDVTLAVVVDATAPVITFTANGRTLDPRETQPFRADVGIVIDVHDAFLDSDFTATRTIGGVSQTYSSGELITAEGRHTIHVAATDAVGNTSDETLEILLDKTAPAIALSVGGVPLDTTKENTFTKPFAVDVAISDALDSELTQDIELDGSDYTSGAQIAVDGHHVITVNATDDAGNASSARVELLLDQTGPAIAFFANGVQLDPSTRNDFKVLPAIEIRVVDALSSESYEATLDGVAYTSGTPLAEGHHTIAVHATDALANATDATLTLLVDVTPPVVVLRNAETHAPLPATVAIFGEPLTVEVDYQDTSLEKKRVILLDGVEVDLLTIADYGQHALAVTVTDELGWSSTATAQFIIDTKPPVVTVSEGTTPLVDGASFTRDIVINVTADDITPTTVTATIDGVAYTPGTLYTTDGTHTLVVNVVDDAGNQAPTNTLTFHIDRNAPEVVLRANGAPLKPDTSFAVDVTFTVDVVSATEATRVATIDGAAYTLGTPYTAEGHHHIKVVVTNMAALSTTVEADFTIDKTPPTLSLFAKEGTPFTDAMQFAADITPFTVANDNLASPPDVVVLLNGQALAPNTAVTEEREHTISATATDKAGNATSVGPFAFVLDKTAPDVTVNVDGEPLVDGALFNKEITPEIEATDLTESTFDITLDGTPYTRGTVIDADGAHTLVVKVKDALQNERALDPLHFTIDKTAPIVRIIDKETNAAFTGGQFSRAIDLKVEIDDVTTTITTATLVDRMPEPDRESPWSSEQAITSDGHYTLKVTVTDEAGWVTVVPPIDFTIDKAAPVITVTESGAPLVTNTIFNRDATPKIEVQDTTATTVDAKLDGAAFVSETAVTQEAWHTLTVKATDALGFVTELLPIEFAVDKTPPVVTVTENGVPFAGNVNLDHDAAPHVAVSDVTAYTIDAKVDGQPFALGSLVTAEGPHTLDVTVKDAAQWTTTVPTIHFVVDKTAPVVTVSESETGGPLESGDEFGATIAPFVRVTDITATTVIARLNGNPYTPNTPIEADGEYLLEVTVTDAVGRATVVPPIAFLIDKTAPVVQVLELGQPFASGTKLNRAAELELRIEDRTLTTTSARIGDAPFTFPGTFAQDGRHTLNVTVTDKFGLATVVPAIDFVVDQTPPVVAITVDGQPLQSGAAFNRPSVRPDIQIQDTTTTTTVATLNGAPYTFGTDINAEGKYTLAVEVTDELQWKTVVPAIVFFVDRTPPVVTLKEGDSDLTDGLWFNRDVTPRAVVTDTTAYETTATLAKDGGAAAAYVLGTPIAAEGRYTLTVSVTDAVTLKTDVPPVTFTIDKTSPAITVLYPAANAELTTPQVVVVGDSDDAITVTVNETIDTTIDATEKKYASDLPLDLLEGENALTVVGVDRAGNSTTLTQIVRLDTRAPELAITAPAANACLTTPTIEVAGTVGDPNVAGIRVSVAPGTATPIDATLSADRRTWTASVTFPAEGKFVVSATARDNGGHESVASVQVSIDSTKPRIEITDGGVPVIPPFVNRAIAPLVRVIDADAKATLTVTLDGAPYVSGTPILVEKDYELKASATDCAGNKADDDVVRFTIDRTPPQFVSIAPANGAVVGEITQVSGTVSPDTVSVVVEATGAAATVTNGTFAFASLPIAEGRNAFTLVAIDRAGNATRLDYSFRVKSSAPTVEIVENGSPIVGGTRYTRPVVVDIRSNEPDATITATHNGQPFTSGATVSENGSHTIRATASDSFGHSASHEITFTIDSNGPVVTIAEPLDGAAVTADRIRVRGTIAGDPVSALINGSSLPLTGGAFDAEVALELGLNSIAVVAFDAAGNAGQASVDVTRNGGGVGLIVHTPTDNMLTNRRTTTVAGQVLTPGVSSVTVNGIQIPVDAAGAFRKTDFALTEGANVITATVNKGEASGTVTVTVNADFTPPAVTVRESGKLLEEEERFATQAVLTVEASDGGQPLAPQILLDASPATAPMTVTATGGHTIIVTAQDAAGNEKRVERTFFIGTSGAGGCALSDFDPADGSVVTTNTITLVGRSGGAVGVKVDETAATVSNGTFSALVNLSSNGAKSVTIQCTDANGNNTGTPKTITLTRVTGAPSIDITAPADRSVTDSETVTVNGTVSSDAAKVVVNGAAAIVTGTTFTAANVRLASGVNTITARAYNAAGVVTTDSIHVTRLADLPKISITSPTAVFLTSAATIDVSGTWTNLDPTSITVTGGASASTVQASSFSDTTGTFVAASVALAAGPQTITVHGTDRLGRAVTATAAITRADGLPTIAIASPADNAYFGTSAGAKVTVSGSFTASSGATIEVNGVAATIDTVASTFTAQVDFSTIPGGLTPVIARLAEPDGDSALDAIRVTKLSAAPTVTSVFPEADGTNVDPGTLPLVLFSAPMDRTSVRNAFELKTGSGTTVNGDVTLERDVLVFAPAVLLTSGETYTIRVAAGAQDLGGNALAADFTSTFTVASAAPATAPSLGTYPSRVCESIDLTGTAPAGAQLRFELGTLKFNTYASGSGAFSYRVPLSGRSGFQVVRVRVVGSDGSLSPAAEAHFEVDCAGPQVVNATVDRTANVVSITFSKAIDLATVTVGETGSVRLQLLDGTFVGGTASASTPTVVSIAPAQNLATATFTLTVTTAVKDTNGAALTSAYSRAFSLGDELPDDGSGYIAGEVFDAETGRPLPGVLISIDVPTAAFARRVASEDVATTAINDVASTATVSAVTDNRGRYVRALPEGAHTIRASADGYTTVWRQIIVRAGQGVIPTDIRLTPRGPKTAGTGAALVLTHGGAGANPLSSAVALRIPAGVVATGNEVTVTSLGAQSLPGLLPLGWSPIASAEIVSNTAPLSGSELTFAVPRDELIAAAQTLTAVRYHEDRDEWRVIATAVNVASDGKATLSVSTPGAYALVYPDKAPLQSPPAPTSGGVLTGVADPCATDTCPPLAAKNALALDPPAVLPTQRTVATLDIHGSGEAKFPSGTAVQAYVDEELHLADGTRDVVSPFVTDLLLYRNLAGDTGVAEFHLAPSTRAAEVVLEVGYDHIRIVPYPERVDRGALIGPEGGRVPADDLVSVEIPAAATTEALKATATSIRDFASYGTIAGYRIVGGLSLSLQWASAPAGEEVNPVELLKPARATFTVTDASLPSQLILAEVLEGTPYGRAYRLASQITALEGGTRFSTKTIDRAVLPVDGIIREGTYLLLAPNAPIAFAHGIVRLGTDGPIAANARVTPATLDVVDVARLTGIFALPVQAIPAAPFTLVPRTGALGDGVVYQHPTSPESDVTVNIGELVITAQPPQIVATSPSDNATSVGISAFVQVTFSRDIDPASASVTVSNATGAVSVAGPIVTWKPATGELLEPNTRYTVTVGPTTRALNGATLGRSHTFSFTTVATVTSGEVHTEKIRITIPDAAGTSRIVGDAGSLPAGWSAVPVRRGIDFSSRPTATAATDGSFSMTVAGVTTSDLIDLRVVNSAGAVAAIIPLTPFMTEDGRGFIAPVSTIEMRFTSVDGITIIVPAGAFDVPTTITLTPEPLQSFTALPNFAAEFEIQAAVRVEFEGRPKKTLNLELPLPANYVPGTRRHYLGWLGQSIRGPRMAIVDTLRVEDGRFTTRPSPTSGAGARRIAASRVLVGEDAKEYLVKLNAAGAYAALSPASDIASGFAFFFLDTLEWATQAVDIFINNFLSLFVPDIFVMEGRGRVVVPGLLGTPFTISGVDSSSGLTLFSAAYDPVTIGEAGNVILIDSPNPDVRGPLPVYGAPFRVESADLHTAVTRIPRFRLELASGVCTVTPIVDAAAERLAKGVRVQALNTRTGALSLIATADENGAFSPLSVAAEQADRIIVLASATDVDPRSTISIVFNEGIALPSDFDGSEEQDQEFLRSAIKLRQVAPSEADLTEQTVFLVDSNNRRITLGVAAELVRGATYEVVLTPALEDSAGNPLARGVVTTGTTTVPSGGNQNIPLRFVVRKPDTKVRSFELQPAAGQSASLRDLARYGNVAFVSALEGGLLAYDLSDPAALTTIEGAQPKPMSFVPGNWNDSSGQPITNGFDQHWAVSADHHGRVYSSGFTSTFGVIRSYRVEDFLKAAQTNLCTEFPSAPPNALCKFHGAALVSWRPGYGAALPYSTSVVVSDRPEATPRKMHVLVQDDEESYSTLADFGAVHPVFNQTSYENDGFVRFDAGFLYNGTASYLLQRVTVVNETLNMRWSADIRANAGMQSVTGIIARPSDKLKVLRNLRTYAVVSLFGYGLGIYDLTAVESNDAPNRPAGYLPLKEQIVLTKAETKTPSPIRDLAFSPEAALVPGTDAAAIPVYALDSRYGVLGASVSLPTESADSSYARNEGLIFKDRAVSYIHPRLAVIEQAFAEAGMTPLTRFSSVAYHVSADGKSYLLVAGGDYGLLVLALDAGSTINTDLSAGSLADVVWIPTGAWAVRRVEGAPLAVVVDGSGRVLLVDLNRIDESALVSAPDELFPTALTALTSEGSSGVVGVDDPRIIWKSDVALVSGTLAPIYDARTGTLFGGDILTRTIRVTTAADPRIVMKADIGKPEGLTEIGGPVPLGVEVPAYLASGIAASPNASLAAFRLEAWLPGGAARALESLGRKFSMAIESETLAGVEGEQSWLGLPKSQLRTKRRDGSSDTRPTDLVFERVMPRGASDAENLALERELRHQEGYNTYLSPWIVAISDPMASEHLDLTSEQRASAGCIRCDRPSHLKGKSEAQGVYELLTGGRYLAVRPDGSLTANVFSESGYAYLGENGRLVARFSTTPAEVSRPKSVRTPAQYPAVAEGLLSDTTFLHSGEVETGRVDMTVRGRAGMHLAVDRTYHSRTMGGSYLGRNWDSRLFRRLRALPNGDVEYADGEGELWLFKRSTSTAAAADAEVAAGAIARYQSPKGLFLQLVRTERGWTMFSQKWEITTFDALGRLESESEEFYDPQKPNSGNTFRYLYDETGRLVQVLDADGRPTKLTYWERGSTDPGAYAGLLRKVEDWRERSVLYEYDAHARLTHVRLPEFGVAAGVPDGYVGTSTGRPTIEYSYWDVPAPAANAPLASEAVTDYADFAGNLKSIREPAQFSNGQPRVIFTYDTSNDAQKRDRVVTQTWPCGTNAPSCTASDATFTWTSSTSVTTSDMLGQVRKYELVGAQVDRVTQVGLPVIESAGAGPNEPLTTQDLTTDFDYTSEGQLAKVTLPNGLVTQNTWVDATGGAPGQILTFVTETPSAGPAIETKYVHDTAPNAVATVVEVGRRKADAGESFVMREAQAPSRERLTVSSTDEGVKQTQSYDTRGQLRSFDSATPGGDAATIKTTIDYYDAFTDPSIAKGRPRLIRGGSGEVAYELQYEQTANAGERETIRDIQRGKKTITERDAYSRVISEVVEDAGGTTLSDEKFGYDKDGNLVYQSRLQSGLGIVETFHAYDSQGRLVSSRMTNARVGDSLVELTTRTSYKLETREIIETDPSAGTAGAAETVTKLDGLGREAAIERRQGTEVTRTTFAYDIHGERAYESDGVRVAVHRQYDDFGREIAVVASDGTRGESRWNAWDELIETKELAADGALVAQSKQFYTAKGRLRRSADVVDATGRSRLTRFTWDDGEVHVTTRMGETASIDADASPLDRMRVEQTKRDAAGRAEVVSRGEALGPDTLLNPTETYAETRTTQFAGEYPQQQQISEPRAGISYETTSTYDALGRLKTTTEAGVYTTETIRDELGNVISQQQPGMNPALAKFDARGLPYEQTLPDGRTIRQKFDALGNLTDYVDEDGQTTTFEFDALGRVEKAVFVADGTFEETRYEPGSNFVRARRDRAGQWLSFEYDSGGRVTEIHRGEDPAAAPLEEKRTYDNAGRLARVADADSAIEYADYDLLGRPGTTRTIRYKDGSGLATAIVLDVHTQHHQWSVFEGERKRWRMPYAGSAAPTPEPDTPWRSWIDEQYDGAGNLIAQREELNATAPASGPILAESVARGEGRLAQRTRGSVVTSFGYNDGPGVPSTPSVPVMPSVAGPASGMLGRTLTNTGAWQLAGVEIARDGAKRVNEATDLALGARKSRWSYDDRGRLTGSVLQRLDVGSANEPGANTSFGEADFAAERTITGRLSSTELGILGASASAVQPLSWITTAAGAHQIAEKKNYVGVPAPSATPHSVQTFVFNGSRRESDGRWTTSYDARGRLASMTNADEGRRIVFVYDPNDRIVGRIAEQLVSGAWTIETRANVLARDGLPAHTTWVWDSTVDRLVAIFEAGNEGEPTSPEQGLVRQYVHGGEGYDDPIEVLAKQTDGSVRRYLPIADEAATGSLVAVADESGNLVERILYADSFGDAPRYLNGPVVDRIAARANGNSREIRMHLSETIDPATLATGAKLITNTGTEVAPTSLSDGSTIVFSLTAAEWSALTSGATTVDVVVTDQLRAQGWGTTVAARPPTWARTLYGITSRETQPVVKRETLANLESAFSAPSATQPDGSALYVLPDLYLAASEESAAKLHFDVHLLPYREPASGLVFARARWLDTATQTFTTPDPNGYEDSSTLYAAFAGDPINFRDPTGASVSKWIGEGIEQVGKKVDDVVRVAKRALKGGKGGADEAAEHADDVARNADEAAGAARRLGGVSLDEIADASRKVDVETAARRGGGGSVRRVSKANAAAEAAEATGRSKNTARYGGASQRDILSRRLKETPTLAERKGIVHAFREMRKRGYRLEDVNLRYAGNRGQHGVDLVFSRHGRYAITEAKHGKGLGSLKKDTLGMRQGSRAYNVDRINRYLDHGDGKHADFAERLLDEIARGRTRSFATFYRSRRISELPNSWPAGGRAIRR